MTDLTRLTQAIKGLREAAGYTPERAAADLELMHGWDQASDIIQDFEDPLRITLWINFPMFLYYLLELYCRPDKLRQTYIDCSYLAGYLVSKEKPCSNPSA